MTRNPLPYIGGKAALAPKLVALLPPHHTYVEVFGGVAHVLYRKERSPVEVYNDVDGRLIRLFHVLRDHFDDFAARLRWVLYSRSLHQAWRRLDGTGDPIEDAVRIYLVLKSSLNGVMGDSWAYSRRRATARAYHLSKQAIEAVADRFEGVAIEELDFRKLLPRWDSPDTVFFCDPPYYGPAGEAFWPFKGEDHEALAEMLQRIQGKALITYYDHPEVRRLYPSPGWSMLEHRRTRRAAVLYGRPATRVTELIIANYPLDATVLTKPMPSHRRSPQGEGGQRAASPTDK